MSLSFYFSLKTSKITNFYTNDKEKTTKSDKHTQKIVMILLISKKIHVLSRMLFVMSSILCNFALSLELKLKYYLYEESNSYRRPPYR